MQVQAYLASILSGEDRMAKALENTPEHSFMCDLVATSDVLLQLSMHSDSASGSLQRA